MNNIRLQVNGKTYLLNNNSGKYDRAVKEAGDSNFPLEILAIYDRMNGLIQDENGRNLENGGYWPKFEEAKIKAQNLVELHNKNLLILGEYEKNLYPLINQNVSEKRQFLTSLMTIAAGILAGLFYLFQGDAKLPLYESFLAEVGGFLFFIFIVAACAWLTRTLYKESINLERKLNFYKRTQIEFEKGFGTEFRTEETFREFLHKKVDASKNLDKPFFGSHERWFWIISVMFIAASLPVILLFFLHR